METPLFYVCSAFPRRRDSERVAEFLASRGGQINCEWLYQEVSGYNYPEMLPSFAKRDLNEIKESDLVVVLSGDRQSHSGKSAELGAALALGKTVVLIGKPENVMECHPAIHRFESEEAFRMEVDSTGSVLGFLTERCV
jgi:hypothetical protein